MNRRTCAVAIVAAAAFLFSAAGIALAAVRSTTLSVDSGSPGDQVSIRVDATARIADTDVGLLYLVPTANFDRASTATHCEAIEGEAGLSEMTWRQATVEFNGNKFPGYVGTSRFTVPETAPGQYVVAESVDFVNAGCFVFASFTVTSGSMPNSATTLPSSLQALAVTVGFVLLAVAALIAMLAVSRSRTARFS